MQLLNIFLHNIIMITQQGSPWQGVPRRDIVRQLSPETRRAPSSCATQAVFYFILYISVQQWFPIIFELF